MLLREYETIYILKPDITDESINQVNKRLMGVFEKDGGHVLHQNTWGKKKLAFEMKKQQKGIYVHLLYLSKPTTIHELERNLRMLEPVLAYQTIKLATDVDVEKRLAETAEQEKEKQEKEKKEQERQEQEKQEKEKKEQEKKEQEKKEQEKKEQEKQEQEKQEKEKQEKEKQEQEKKEQEKQEQEKKEQSAPPANEKAIEIAQAEDNDTKLDNQKHDNVDAGSTDSSKVEAEESSPDQGEQTHD